MQPVADSAQVAAPNADSSTMRALRLSILLTVSALVLGSCQMRVEQRFEINEDGSGTVRVITLFDEEAQDIVTFGMGFDGVVQDAPAGFAAEVVEDGDLAGTAMEADFSTLSEIPAITRELSDESGMGTVNVQQVGDAFIFKMALPDEGLSVDGTDMGDLADFGDFEGVDELADAIQLKVVAVLPGHIEDSNADEVSGDTASWTISVLSPPTEMLYASSQPGSSSGFPMVWVLAGAGVILATGLVLLRRRGRPDAPVAGLATEPQVEVTIGSSGATGAEPTEPPPFGP